MKQRAFFLVLTAAAGGFALAAASCGGKFIDSDASADSVADVDAEGPYLGECCDIQHGPFPGPCDHDAHDQIDWDSGTVFCLFNLNGIDAATHCAFVPCSAPYPVGQQWGCALRNDFNFCPEANHAFEAGYLCGPDCQDQCCNGYFPGAYFNHDAN